MTGVVLALGDAGWIALAALFAAASIAPFFRSRQQMSPLPLRSGTWRRNGPQGE
jgi:hypothetical protein